MYKDAIGQYEYEACIQHTYMGHSAFTAFEYAVYRKGEKQIERSIPYFFIDFLAEDFPLANKKYFFEGLDEYERKIEEAIADMAALGFSCTKRRGTVQDTRLYRLEFVHDETKRAAEQKAVELAMKLNGGERGFVRFGEAPKSGKSYNYRDKFFECGVSVYHAVFFHDGSYEVLQHNPFELFGAHSYSSRPAYRLYGEEIGTGSDGEPVLKVTKSIKLEQNKAN